MCVASKMGRCTGNVKEVSGLGHQAPWPCCVEERGWVVDFHASVGSEVRFKIRKGSSDNCQEDGRLKAHDGVVVKMVRFIPSLRKLSYYLFDLELLTPSTDRHI